MRDPLLNVRCSRRCGSRIARPGWAKMVGMTPNPFVQTFVAAREQSAGRVTRFAAGRIAAAALGRLQRPAARLSLRDVAELATPTTSPTEAADRLVPGSAAFVAAGDVAVAEISGTVDRVGLSTPGFGTGAASLSVLYAVVRALEPEVMLETGVADGLSTAVILAAMNASGVGALHSVDISPDVGRVAKAAGDTTRWRLHVHRHLRGEQDMRALLRQLGTVDVYYHDSGHSWLWQTFEYETVVPHVRALVLSDDIDASWAFAEHCQGAGVRPIALVEPTKVFGGYRVDAQRRGPGPIGHQSA